ncbi:MAG TPA: TonB-dependent receptor [Methylomirabilota bacterium]|jgi:vitamin B12 transporter|nr:TonB-dependent receptor [Methylomirabilota bacterium]
MTWQSRWGGVVGLGILLETAPLAAQPAEPPVQRAERIVVTATRVEEPLEEIGASVTIIPEEIFRAQEYRTVEEALRTVPGLDVQRSGSLGKLTTVRIRGAGPAQIQVLIDGVRVKSLTTGDFDFADLTLDDVERIEVVRGPQSTLYGADAIGGVINIITKRGKDRPSGFLDLEAGNYDTFRERAGLAGARGPLSFSLGVSRLDFGGQYQNDEQRLTSANGRIGYALPNRGEVSVVARYSDGHRGIPFKTVFPDFDLNREQDDELALLSLEWRQPWTAWYDHALRLSVMESRLTFRDPDSLFEPRSEIETRRREVDWLHHLHFGRMDTVTVGLEYRNEKGTSENTFSRTTDTYAAFLQNELRLFERLFLTAGVRHDDNSAFGDKTTGRAAAAYLVKETDTRLKASWGQGFRAPTFNDLFFPATFPPCPAFGNPNLRPEESESWDAGAEQQFWRRRGRIGATYFRNDFKDLIQTALVDPVNFCFQAQNVGRARTQGVEVEASLAPLDGLLFTLAYTYTETEDRTTGLPLRRFAPHRWALSGIYELLRGLTLTAELFIVSSQFEGAGVARNKGYTVVNAGAAYRLPWRWGLLSDVTVHVKVTNLLDEDYSEVRGFPALGPHVVAGLRGRF